MVKPSASCEKEILENLKEETGGGYKDWKGKIIKSGFKKRNDIVKWLKDGMMLMNFSKMHGTEF